MGRKVERIWEKVGKWKNIVILYCMRKFNKKIKLKKEKKRSDSKMKAFGREVMM